MAKENLIAKKYAQALVEIDSSQETLDGLNTVKEALSSCIELKSSFENPSVNEENKMQILDSVFASKISKNTLNLLKLCISKRRSKIITLLAKYYEDAFFAKNNIGLAQIQTTSKLSDSDLTEIKKQLEKVFSKTIEVETKENPELIAGLKINVDNKVIDYSLKSKIKNLRQSIN